MLAEKTAGWNVFSKLIVLWLAALPLMGSPGPATMSLAAIGSAYGAGAGLSYLGGIIAGTLGVLLLVATGVTGAVLAIPDLRSVVTVAATLYILYLAYRIAMAPTLSKTAAKRPPPSFAGGFYLAIANPKAFAAIGAVYSGTTLVEADVLTDSAVKILALALVILVVNPGWLFFGHLVSSVLRHPRAGRIANWIFALLLVASVIPVLF